MNKRGYLICSLALAVFSTAAYAKDLGDILLQKGLITEQELKQAREEDKQKAAAEESRHDSIVAKLPKWLDVITPFGDIRNRVEGFYGNNYHAQTRERFRARLGVNANVTDEISGTVRMATGDANDPISTNQTYGNVFTRKPFNLDWAYMTVKPGKTFGIEPGWGQVMIGKMPVTLARESELIWDDDLSPEGATETLNLWEQREGFLRTVRVNALQWEMNEVANNNDSWIAGGQLAVDTGFGSFATWSGSFADYDFVGTNQIARSYLSPFGQSKSACTVNGMAGTCYGSNSSQNTSLANSNDLKLSAADAAGNKTVTGFLDGFNLINLGTEVDFPNPVGVGIPAGVWTDYVVNTSAGGRNQGVSIGFGIGKAQRDWYHDSLKNPGDWGASYSWEYVEKDAVFSMFSYSDFYYQQSMKSVVTQKGSSNVTGSILRLDYELFPNFQLTAKSHFINVLESKFATSTSGKALNFDGNSSLTRLQLDAVLKF